MKKASLFLVSLILAGAAWAQDLLKSGETSFSVLGIGLAAPIQFPPTDWKVCGIRLGGIYGENAGVHGLDVGLTGRSRANVAGVQALAAMAWDDYDFAGCQVSGIANTVLGQATGLQVATIANYDRGGFTGVQFAAVNVDGSLRGLSLGLLNATRSVSGGLQFGLYNANANEFHGWSIGAINRTERFSGLMFGLVNTAPKEGRGLQIGLFNSAGKLTGVQIGVLNLIGNGEIPVLPVVNAAF